MTGDGKLVRDRIPDIIRASGRDPEVRHVTGDALRQALAAKLVEEASEAAEVVGDRQKLVGELADLVDVVVALQRVEGISEDEILQAAVAKAAERGRFDTGAYLVSAVPEAVRRFSVDDVTGQRVPWKPERWAETFSAHQAAYQALVAHSEADGGIARSFIHSHADRAPVDLFLMAMVWGYGPAGYGPYRTREVLAQDGAAEKIAAIVEATRRDGAEAGWHALLTSHRITGLDMSFGTKLLYFAGYTSDHQPHPLVLDERVRASLQKFAPGTVPPRGKTVFHGDYLRYLELAENWAIDPVWQQRPDVVEYALFSLG